ncbi:MAG: peptide chain release factor N(5)-glutamine methyltransferase [Firmicutes bacterium]|nr:peptide chain release factor N(5)-glutamine methyltransferase [Bacillota bacterium]
MAEGKKVEIIWRAGARAGVTIAEALRKATMSLKKYGIPTARLDAEVLLAFVLACRREDLYAHPERVVDHSKLDEFRSLLEKRINRVPVAYLRSLKEFMAMEFLVTPAVLIPRPETEVLVEAVLSEFACRCRRALIADIGTGSGAIAVALAYRLTDIEIVATDISPSAISIAKLNAKRHHVQDRIRFEVGDLLEPLSRLGLEGRLDAIVSNPPYIASSEMGSLPPELSFEPKIALDAGEDGLSPFRRMLAGAAEFLKDSGLVALEVSSLRASEVARLAENLGYNVSIRQDYAGRDRVVMARR